MSESEGLRIISVTKSLEAFQRGDQNISRYFGSTILAGHAGLFLSSLKNHRKMKYRKLRVLAAAAHIEGPMLATVAVPWLKTGGFIELAAQEDEAEVRCNVLDYAAVLSATSALFRSLSPTPEEVAVIGIVDLGMAAPQLRGEILNASNLGNVETLNRALGLAKSYNIVRVLEGPGISEPLVYSPLIWGDKMTRAGKALSHLTPNRRAILLALIERIRTYQGLPLERAIAWAVAQGEGSIVDLAVGLGLLDKTVITAEGQQKVFLTTPHLYGELAVTQGRDVCDRIRLFLDSIRHGQHYGKWYTGRIADPAVLLSKLINVGEIGPCTAIGRDYQLVEKSGIINVRPSGYKPGQFIMEVVQTDTVSMVRDIVTKQDIGGRLGAYSSSPCGQDSFVSSEEMRARLGEPPQKVREAEQEMLRSLREM